MDFEIPEFILTRRLSVKRTTINKKEGILFRGIDKDNCPYTIYRSITVDYKKKPIKLEKEPMFFHDPSMNFERPDTFSVDLEFQGNYGEQNFKMEILLQTLKEETEVKYLLEYSPRHGQWINCFEF